MTGLLLIIFGLVSATYAGPVVDTVYGPVEGLTEHLTEESFIGVDSDFDVFLGIPFAKPPVGDLRFANPERPDPWSENYDATYYRPMCLQMLPGVLSGGVDEDCLYLNVYAPSPMPTNAAVMVWIHGGAYNVGTGGRALYGGVPLAAVGGVIVVTVNYRLGSLGFLSTGDEAAMGNFGSFDQVMALRWVQENIANFGGDPSRVTIFGESAGGTSVGLHVVSKESQDLFQSAIMQSGSTLTPFAFNPDIDAARSEAFKLGENVGCSTSSSSDLVDCLRTKSAVDVLVGGLKFAILSAPVVDNRFLTGNPQDLLESGDFKHRNILLGSNHDEGTAWALSVYPDYTLSRTAPHMSRADYDEHRDDNIDGVVNDIILDAMDQQYIDWSVADDPNADYLQQYVNEITDQSFAAPADALARAFYQHGAGQAYLYEMTHVPSVSMYSYSLIGPRWLGVTHGEEIPFVFGWAFIPEVQQYRRNLKDDELEFMVKMMQYWTNFAKTGDPNSADLPNWPAFTVPELEYMVLEPDLRSDRALRADTAAFWNGLVPKLAAS
ncbi:acetylcholinesterase-like [Diadema antillarum]|uniref:acetylcholinesterase-like n=1 Tax=Diadema antillarum TaxID=105358 RepID=UPI003A86C64F